MCSVLESLEQEYRRDEDWCGGHDKLGATAETDHVIPLISKHLEQKEAFLKVPPPSRLHPEGGGVYTGSVTGVQHLPLSITHARLTLAPVHGNDTVHYSHSHGVPQGPLLGQ